ncbi:MAG: TVP38/TMEM64 family protein, partial [Rhodospirillales bacterium]|nr:TVP38/TMEM64 family protein [Rhodospirillales bacterium]
MICRRFILLAGLVLLFAVLAAGEHYLGPGWISGEIGTLHGNVEARPIAAAGLFFLAYVALTALSLPASTVLTLASGALFGVVEGSILVSFAATIGASLAFLAARYLLRGFALARFPGLFARIDAGIAKDGVFYLISLRLVPAVPYFAVNLLAGLTSLSLSRF